MSDSDRLTDLEMRIAYLEDNLNVLDTVLTQYVGELTLLKRQHAAVLKKFEEIETFLADLDPGNSDEPPPPHY